MLLRTKCRRQLNVAPEMHRFSQSTFHEGTHRQAPGDSTPWRDVATPINRVKAWWVAPAAKGGMLAAWCITFVTATYTYSLQKDAKATYMLNNVLLRNLHQESLRADANQDRAAELQLAVKKKMIHDDKVKSDQKQSLKQCSDAKETLQNGLVNYELELSREKARSDIVHDRNQNLVKELHSIRTELNKTKKDNFRLTEEVEKLRKVVKRLESV
jgi:hypothetical protein